MYPKPGKTVIKAWARLMRAQQAVLARVESDLKAAGLPPLGWYDVLLELSRAEGGRLRQFEVGSRVLLSKFNVSRLLDRLEQEGLVRRQACAEDRRGAHVAITRAGRELQKKMWPVYERAIARHFARHYTEQQAGQLAELLRPLIPDRP